MSIKRKRILITGASGMLGSCLVQSLQNSFDVYASGTTDFAQNQAHNYLTFDLKNAEYTELMEWSQPDIVIHCAALTDGTYCARNPEEAFLVNGHSCRKLLEGTSEKVKIIYVSTDAVFSSSLHLAKENDVTMPENVYGKSKELGEFFLQISNRNYHIIRTTIVGLNTNKLKQGFVEWLLWSSINNKPISLFNDVYFTPITIWQFAQIVEKLILENVDAKVLHFASTGVCTKFEFGVKLLETLGMSIKNIKKGSILNFKTRANRATDQSLDSSYSANILEIRMPTIDDLMIDLKNKISKDERYYVGA